MSGMTIVVGATDAATPVLRRVRGEADRLGDSLRRAAQASSRIGGAVGGIGGRVLGAASMGGGFAAAGLAGIGMTMTLAAVKSAIDRQSTVAMQQVATMQRIADINRSAARALEQVAAGGVGRISQARRIPHSRRYDAFEGLGTDAEIMEASQAAYEAGLYSREQIDQAELYARATGRLDPNDVRRFARPGATAERQLTADLIGRGVSPRRARALAFESVGNAMLQRGGIFDQTQNAANKQDQESMRALREGRTLSAVEANNERSLNPLAEQMRDARNAVLAQYEQLKAASAKAEEVGGLMDSMFQFMAALGGRARWQQQADMFDQLRQYGNE
jgi:hypothetical protein